MNINNNYSNILLLYIDLDYNSVDSGQILGKYIASLPDPTPCSAFQCYTLKHFNFTVCNYA